MYAREENNKIKVYKFLPSIYTTDTKEEITDFDTLSDEEHRGYGFYPLIRPDITKQKTYKHGEIVFNVDHFEYSIVLIYPDLTLEETKKKMISDLKQNVNKLFTSTQWYYDREVRTTKLKAKDNKIILKSVPDEIVLRDRELYKEHDRIELEINSKVSIEDVLEYEIIISL